MSNIETPNSEDAKMISNLFAQIKETPVEPSPYLKTRVLARVNEEKKLKSSLMFWKFLSAGSMVAVALLAVFSLNLYKKSQADGIANQAYVIHIDFNEADKTTVANAQIELPQGVHFVSKNQAVRDQRKLTLPVAVKALGKGKLPFVVSSDFAGESEIKVRLFNDSDQLVREQVLKLKFAKGTSTQQLE